MNKHWANLMLDEDRQREPHHAPTLPIFGRPAPKRFPEGTEEQVYGAELETRFILGLYDRGRTLPCRRRDEDYEGYNYEKFR